MKTIVTAIALLAAATAGAAPADETPIAYSHAIPLALAADSGVAKLRLPQAVYLHARTASLADVRVFDRDGKPRPYALMQPAVQRHTAVQFADVRVFPLTEAGASQGGTASAGLAIRTDAQGRLISVSSEPAGGKPSSAAPPALSGLILEMDSTDRRPIGALRFELPAGVPNYTATLSLETSNDLQHWEHTAAADLHWIANASAQTLSNNRMELAPSRFRYARIRWQNGTPVAFTRVTAEMLSESALPPPMERIVLQPTPGRQDGDLQYAASPAIPVQRAALQFGSPNVSYPATIGTYRHWPASGKRRRAAWHFEADASATFYRIVQRGTERNSGEIALDSVQHATWVVRPTAGASGELPALRLAWTPATLLFLANGKGPYRLVFGRNDAEPVAQGVAQVAPGFSAEELLAAPPAQAGPAARQAATPGREPELVAAKAAQSASARVAALWGVLLAGLAAVGMIVYRLARQMKQESIKN